jgi:hypothetical protein
MASSEQQTETAPPPPAVSEDAAEAERLRTRVAALEAELAEVHGRANAAIAAAQERTYWLDRWHLDLNAMMRRRGASEFRSLVRAVRVAFRAIRKARRSLSK